MANSQSFTQGGFPSLPSPDSTPRMSRWKRFNSRFLLISIAAHLLFGVGATYLIVQTIQAKRKQTFAAPSSGPNAPTRALEHKVQMQKRQLQQVDGVDYAKDPKGNPILPVFRMADVRPAPSMPGHPYPPHRDDGPVWKIKPAFGGLGSLFSQ